MLSVACPASLISTRLASLRALSTGLHCCIAPMQLCFAVYHVLVRDQTDCQELLPHSLFNLLSPGGVLMILAGNANEAEIGPNTLTAQQLLLPLLSAGLQLVMLQQTRFDSTEYYDKVLGKRPLAWCAVLQRPRQNAPVE